MNYAVIETGGKQYKVNPGATLEVERLEGEANDSLFFDKVLLYVNEGKAEIGMPYLANVVVRAKLLEQAKGEKIRVLRFLAKSRHRKRHGHRQYISRVKIEAIDAKSAKSEAKKEDVKIRKTRVAKTEKKA